MDQYISCIRDILAIAKSCAPDDFCRVSYIVNNFPQYDEQYIYPICDDLYEYGYIKAVIKRHTPNPSKRLGLIALQDICLNEPNAYNFVQNSELYHSLFSEHIASADKCIQTHKKILSTTSFGLTFCDVCIFGIE